MRGLRINPLKKHGNHRVESFFSLTEVPWCANGFTYRPEEEPGRHVLHQTGAYYIQEPSAMAPVVFLEAAPGERVLDLCAAPGGKSTQIAECMAGEGVLIANEVIPKRAAVVAENLERMGVCAAAVTVETPERLAAVFPEWFDRILVDAPCSGEGMFRKNPAAIGEWSPEQVALCAGRQKEILRSAVQMLSPGGRLVYSTCTFSREEDEDNVQWFLEEYPEMTPVSLPDCAGFVPALGESPASLPGCLKLMPQRIRGEGQFLAVFEKRGEAFRMPDPVYAQRRPGAGEVRLFREFCKNTLLCSFPEERLVLHGQTLYLSFPAIPSLDGLRALRSGLCLGSFKKDRFIPAHALALTLGEKDVVRRMELRPEASEGEAWIHGESLPFAGERGWTLISVEGYSLGWGKCDGRMMKNHYPRGLRR